jgi:hypothetical protein
MGSASAFVIRWINFFTMVSQSVASAHFSILPLLPSFLLQSEEAFCFRSAFA